MPPAGSPRPERGALRQFDGVAGNRARCHGGEPSQSGCIRRVPSAQSHRVSKRRSATCWASKWMSRHCCRPTMRATGSTTSRASCVCRRRLMERYLAAAQQDCRRSAIASPRRDALVQIFHVPDDLPAGNHVEGLPLGTRGGIRVHPPLSGRPARTRSKRASSATATTYRAVVSGGSHQLEIAVDGDRAWNCSRSVPTFPVADWCTTGRTGWRHGRFRASADGVGGHRQVRSRGAPGRAEENRCGLAGPDAAVRRNA